MKESFEYESDEFEVKINENYNTILILPTIISGKYVKLTMIGKQLRELHSEIWYNALRFVEIIGFPQKNTVDRILEICIKGNFESFSDILGPFYFERLLRYGKVEEYFASGNKPLSDISAYFGEIYQIEAVRNDFENCFEIVGNYLFDRGEYEKAMEHYLRIFDYWGLSRVEIVKKDFESLIRIMSETNPKCPNRMWVLNTAEEIGGISLKNEVLAFLTKRY